MTCTMCDGSGKVGDDEQTCFRCDGSGKLPENWCAACQGSGVRRLGAGYGTCTECDGAGLRAPA